MEDHSFQRFFTEYKGAIIGGCIGLLVAAFILSYGFFTTLFIAICVGIGCFLGHRKENWRRALQAFAKLLPQRKDHN